MKSSKKSGQIVAEFRTIREKRQKIYSPADKQRRLEVEQNKSEPMHRVSSQALANFFIEQGMPLGKYRLQKTSGGWLAIPEGEDEESEIRKRDSRLSGDRLVCVLQRPAWGATRGYPGPSDLVAVRGGQVVHIDKAAGGVAELITRKVSGDGEKAAGGEYVLAREWRTWRACGLTKHP